MHKTMEISVERNILGANIKIARKNADLLKKNHVYTVDFLCSIGSGKTLLIEGIHELISAIDIPGLRP